MPVRQASSNYARCQHSRLADAEEAVGGRLSAISREPAKQFDSVWPKAESRKLIAVTARGACYVIATPYRAWPTGAMCVSFQFASIAGRITMTATLAPGALLCRI
jgi:hypothetical protein